MPVHYFSHIFSHNVSSLSLVHPLHRYHAPIMLPKCNNTIEHVRLHEEPIYNGHTFHLIGLWVSGAFALTALVLSLQLIFLHATNYSKPYEQKHIIRVLLMVPIYSLVSFLSFRFYTYYV
jgi:hypothetical protein